MTALDTNVLIYACDKSDPRRQQIALELLATVTDGVLLWQVACEFVAASRKLNDRGFTPIDAWKVNSTGRRNTSMMRCCNAETETEKVRPGGSACDAFAWSAAGNGACGAATVLEGDRAGAVE